MPWLFLLVSLALGALTLNIYHPLRRDPLGAAISFGLGLVHGELALHHIVWQALVAGAFIAGGALEGLSGKIGLGICAISWVAMAGHYLKASEVRELMERALSQALGAGYLAEIQPELRAGLDARVDWLRLARVVGLRHRTVERVRGIRFARTGGVDLGLDVYWSPAGTPGRPVLLQMHGGGYVLGSKEEQGQPICQHMAARGWVCVNANYRLSPRATFPEQLVDMKRALAWIREHIVAYGGDPAFVVATGGSAGGHLCAMLALTPDDPSYQPGFEHVDTRVQACVPFYGFFDTADRERLWAHPGLGPLMEGKVLKAGYDEDPAAYDRASPLVLVRPEAPPFMIIHGGADSLIAPAVSRNFARALRTRATEPVVHVEIPGAQHAFDVFYSLRTQLVLHGVARFLAWVYSRHLETRVGPGGQARRALGDGVPLRAGSADS